MAVALSGVVDWDVQTGSAASFVYTSTGTTITAGRLVEGCFGYQGVAMSVSSIVDSLGNTYTIVDDAETAVGRAVSFYKENVAGGSNPQFTITLSGAATNRIFGFREWSGCATTSALAGHVDNPQAAPANTANAITSTAMTPSANNCGISGWCVSGNLILAAAAGTNFTRDTLIGAPAGEKIAAEKLTTNQTTAASVAATFTDTTPAEHVLTFVMAFKEPGGGPTNYPLTLDGTSYALTDPGTVTLQQSSPLTWLRVGR